MTFLGPLIWIVIFAVLLAALLGIGRLVNRSAFTAWRIVLAAVASALISTVAFLFISTSTPAGEFLSNGETAVSYTEFAPSSLSSNVPKADLPSSLALENSSAEPMSSIEETTFANLSEEAPVEESEPMSKTVVCIGDSITSGGVLYYDEPDGWPVYLQDMLYSLRDDWTVVNLGVSDTTLLDEGRLPYRSTGNIDYAKELSPDIVIVMLGTNDSWDSSWNASAFQTELRALVNELHDACADTRIVLMAPPAVYCEPYPTASNPFSMNDALLASEIRSIVRETAESTGLQFVDVYRLTEGHPEWFPDTVHPNGNGARAIASYVFDAVFDNV